MNFNFESIIAIITSTEFLLIIIAILFILIILMYFTYKNAMKDAHHFLEKYTDTTKLCGIQNEMYEDIKWKWRYAEKELYKLKKEKLLESDKKLKIEKTKYTGKKVIIGNYNYELAVETRKVFVKLGMDVDICCSAEEIMYRIIEDEEQFDLIITNNTYQDKMSGQELLRELKDNDNFDTPIVVCTVEHNSRDEFLSAGYDEFLAKPVEKKDVLKVLEKLDI